MRTIILYEDNDILIVRKAAGMATQSAAASQMDVESELRNYLGGKELYVVHRLDQPVEGLLVFAKTRAAAAELNRQVQSKAEQENQNSKGKRTTEQENQNSQGKRTAEQENQSRQQKVPAARKQQTAGMGKIYHALACGKVTPESGELVDYLIKTKNGLGQMVPENQISQPQYRDAKRAVLSYRTLEYREAADITLLEVRLETGRFHQIRLQLQNIGHPIAGDRKYGGEAAAKAAAALKLHYAALCACRLELIHPRTKKPMSFEMKPDWE